MTASGSALIADARHPDGTTVREVLDLNDLLQRWLTTLAARVSRVNLPTQPCTQVS